MESSLSFLIAILLVKNIHISSVQGTTGQIETNNRLIASSTRQIPNDISPSPVPLISSTGKVIKKEGTLLYVNTPKGIISYDIPEQTPIVRNQSTQDLDSLRGGDSVTVTLTPESEIIAVSATAPVSIDVGRVLLAFASVGFFSSGIVLALHLLAEHPIFQPENRQRRYV